MSNLASYIIGQGFCVTSLLILPKSPGQFIMCQFQVQFFIETVFKCLNIHSMSLESQVSFQMGTMIIVLDNPPPELEAISSCYN